MTDNQLFALFQPAAPMPADVSERIRRRVFSYLRRQLMIRRVVALVALFMWMATQQASAAIPIVITAVVIDHAGQRMPGAVVDVHWAGPNTSAVARMTTDDNGEVLFPADVGDNVMVRVHNCHKAKRTIQADNEPIMVAPSCLVWLPIVEVAR